MFCKCYFASIWEQIEWHPASTAKGQLEGLQVALESKVQLRPVYLPAISYLVEADGGWFASCYARFQQARRHSQGVAELSYVILQYVHVMFKTGIFGFPLRAHRKIWGIAGKMATVHIINTLHAMSMLMSTLFLAFALAQWVWAGNLWPLLQSAQAQGLLGAVGSQDFSRFGLTSLCTIFGPVPPIGVLMTATTYFVIKDLLEGRLTQSSPPKPQQPGEESPCNCSEASTDPMALDVQGSAFGTGGLNWKKQLSLFGMIQNDFLSMAELTMLGYGLVPCTMAAWSLMRNGTKFEYIVAAKPN